MLWRRTQLAAAALAALLAAACLPAAQGKNGPIWSWSGQFNSPFWDPMSIQGWDFNLEMLDVSDVAGVAPGTVRQPAPNGPANGIRNNVAAQRTSDARLNPKPSDCTPQQFRGIALELMISANSSIFNGASDYVRLAFHNCGMVDHLSRDGGCSGGWIRTQNNLKDGHNAGLGIILNGGTVDPLTGLPFLTPTELTNIRSKPAYASASTNRQFKGQPCITWADMITLAGVVSIEAVGGPPVGFLPGRMDLDDSVIKDPNSPQTGNRLPDGNFGAEEVKYWCAGLGFTIRECVALIGGGHTMGGANPPFSGWNGFWTNKPDLWPTRVQQAKAGNPNAQPLPTRDVPFIDAEPASAFFVDLLTLPWLETMQMNTNPPADMAADPNQDPSNPRVVLPGYMLNNGIPRLMYTNPQPGAVAASNGQFLDAKARGIVKFRLPSDIALRTHSALSYWSLYYAKYPQQFEKDFQLAYERLMHMGIGYQWKALTKIDPKTKKEVPIWQWKGEKENYAGHFLPNKGYAVDVPAPAAFPEGQASFEALHDSVKHELNYPGNVVAINGVPQIPYSAAMLGAAVAR